MNLSIPVYGDPLVDQLIANYFDENEASRVCAEQHLMDHACMVIDHITLRCADIASRVTPFLTRGYLDRGEVVEYPTQGWWARIYRKERYPALFIDQAYTGSEGEKSIIPHWVAKFGDQCLHHIAVRVDDIEQWKKKLEKLGTEFSGEVIGHLGTRLRQIFTASEVRDGEPYSVLELIERNGYDGFYPEQADSLMQSSTKIKS